MGWRGNARILDSIREEPARSGLKGRAAAMERFHPSKIVDDRSRAGTRENIARRNRNSFENNFRGTPSGEVRARGEDTMKRRSAVIPRRLLYRNFEKRSTTTRPDDGKRRRARLGFNSR